MAEIATIARPYAHAVYELAQQAGALNVWSEQLALAAAVAADPDMRRLNDDPAFSKEQYTSLFAGVCGKGLSEEVSNFIRLLIENGRMFALDEIVAQFEVLKAQSSGIKQANVVSAWPLTEAQIKALGTRLNARFGCSVTLAVQVDPQLIGGVIITVGDEVYDASVRGKLQDMAYTLNR